MITQFMAITGKEIRTLLRSRRAFWFLLLALVVVGGAFVGFWFVNARSATVSERARFSREMFQFTSFTLFCALGLITPIMTATAFTSEREHKTLDLLYSTTLPRLCLLLAKWLAAIAFQLALVLCLLPILSLLFQLGGVGLDEYLFAAGMTVLAVATYGMLGLAFSVRLRRSMAAMLWTLRVILALNVGIAFLMIMFNEFIHKIPDEFAMSVLCITSSIYSFAMKLWEAPGSLSALMNVGLPLHILFQVILFLGSAILAWRGLVRGETLKPLLAKKLIDDPEVLARRRKRFPYYLVDPLRRAQVIGDRQNPVIVKEQRTGAAGRPTTTIRLGYVALIVSVPIIGLAIVDKEASSVMNDLLQAGLLFVAILAPVLGATVISREREEGTLDLLMITPLAMRQIVMAKFRAVMRALIILAACVLTAPILCHIAFTRDSVEALMLWPFAVPLALAFLALYGAVAVACSGFCQRNATAIVASYILLIAMTLAPLALFIAHRTVNTGNPYAHGYQTDVFEILSYCLCPFISPFDIVAKSGAARGAELFWSNAQGKGICILFHAMMTWVLARGILEFAAWRMGRRRDER